MKLALNSDFFTNLFQLIVNELTNIPRQIIVPERETQLKDDHKTKRERERDFSTVSVALAFLKGQ